LYTSNHWQSFGFLSATEYPPTAIIHTHTAYSIKKKTLAPLAQYIVSDPMQIVSPKAGTAEGMRFAEGQFLLNKIKSHVLQEVKHSKNLVAAISVLYQ
jgi:hypothetical protein